MAEKALSLTVGARLAVPDTALTCPDKSGHPLPEREGQKLQTNSVSPRPLGEGPGVRVTWRLPAHGLAVFHGAGNVARLSHYFLPRLLMEGKRVLMLDGANSADPRLLERFARERNVPFERFNRGIQIARAFTCFQLTELIARVPKFLADFPAEVVIVTAFPDLYFDEDVRDWDARVAFEQGLTGLQLCAGTGKTGARCWGLGAGKKNPAPSPQYPEPSTSNPEFRIPDPAALAVFSAIGDLAPSPARRQFFTKLCGAANEVWQFKLDADNRLRLVGPGLRPALGAAAMRTVRGRV